VARQTCRDKFAILTITNGKSTHTAILRANVLSAVRGFIIGHSSDGWHHSIKRFNLKISIRAGCVITLRRHPVVEGFPLFTVGSLIVLCPTKLASTKLQDWPEFAQDCLVTDTRTAKRMPMKTAARSA
jgi:hypothetical protein